MTQSFWFYDQFILFIFNVGILIITLSYVEVDFQTRFSVKSQFFTPFELEKCKILFWANLLHTYIRKISKMYIIVLYYYYLRKGSF